MDEKTISFLKGIYFQLLTLLNLINSSMSISDLKILLEQMSPQLHESPYVFVSIKNEGFNNLGFDPLCYFREHEGISIITDESIALANRYSFDAKWAYITLRINSSLSAVGFLAAITSKLTDAGISVNPVSAFFHDHLFVPWDVRDRVMEILHEMSRPV